MGRANGFHSPAKHSFAHVPAGLGSVAAGMKLKPEAEDHRPAAGEPRMHSGLSQGHLWAALARWSCCLEPCEGVEPKFIPWSAKRPTCRSSVYEPAHPQNRSRELRSWLLAGSNCENQIPCCCCPPPRAGSAISYRQRHSWALLRHGMTIHEASQRNDLLEVKRILSRHPEALNEPDKVAWTPLHYAAFTGSVAVLEELLKCGAKVNVRDRHGQTPLHASAIGGHVTTAKPLINCGANIHSLNEESSAPLHIAVYAKRQEFVRFLLSAGADSNAFGPNHWLPLHSACSAGDLEIALLLLEHGADINAETANYWTPLDLAVRGKHFALVEALRSRGAVSSADVQVGKSLRRQLN